MHVIGTAGHVDHGKSTLVHALTGTDPDRWAEEQRRGMTLDLGFAHLTFDDGTEAGIIDVPGHERFLHNMLAGAAGMELVLLVVAANEGARPQTFEHLAILSYLGARATLIVLTKSDTVEAAERERVQARLRADLRHTAVAGAPIFAVSSRTGAGIAELRAGIAAALRALPERAPNAPPYLPVDRVFALPGHGTIVTGTLMQGKLAAGDTLQLFPPGRSVRLRSLQVFGQRRDTVTGGTRVAVNVPGIETGELARGAVLAAPQFEPSDRLRVTFEPHADARAMLRRRTPVRVYVGAAEIIATLVFERMPDNAAFFEAVLHLRRPAIVVPGMPFVARRLSPLDLIGGGTIVGPAPTAESRRTRSGAARAGTVPSATTTRATAAVETAAVAATAAPAEQAREADAILEALERAGLRGATAAQIGAAANLDEMHVQRRIAELAARDEVRRLAKPPAYVVAALADAIVERATALLAGEQRARPWRLGMTSQALAHGLDLPEPALIRVLAGCVEAGGLAQRAGYYATVGFTPQPAPEQQAFFSRLFAPATEETQLPVLFDDLRAAIKGATVPELGAAFDTLCATGALVKVADFVYRGPHLARLREQLEAALRARGQLTVSEFRTLTGISRKYAVPLLEFFDATGVTLRTGDVRVLRQRARTTNSRS